MTSFFKEVLDNMETSERNSGNAATCHGLSSVNSALEITEGVTAAFQKVMEEVRQTTEASKGEHLLQILESKSVIERLANANVRQDADMQ